MIRVLETSSPEPSALAFLQNAYDRMDKDEPLESFLNHGSVYTIYLDDKIVGAMYLKILNEIIGIELFGCDDFDAIKDCFDAFAKDICSLNNATEVLFLGRAGFNKKLPNFECVGTLYRYHGVGVAFN